MFDSQSKLHEFTTIDFKFTTSFLCARIRSLPYCGYWDLVRSSAVSLFSRNSMRKWMAIVPEGMIPPVSFNLLLEYCIYIKCYLG